MNKLFRKIVGVSLGLAMALGTGLAIESGLKESASVHAAETSNGDGTYYDTISGGTVNNNQITWTIGGGHIIIVSNAGGGNAVANTNRLYRYNYMEFTASDGYTINSLQITYSTTYRGANNAGGTAITNNRISAGQADVTVSDTNVSNGTITVTPNSNANTHFYFQNAATGTDNVQLRWSTFKINYSKPSGITVTSIEVLDEFANELSDGDEVNATLVSGNESAKAEVTCEVTYSSGNHDGDVTITSSPSAGFSYNTDDDSTYIFTFLINGDYDVTIASTLNDEYAITVSYHVSGIVDVVYEKVTNVAQLKAGKEIIIGNTDGSYVMAPYAGSGNNCPYVSSTPDASGNLARSCIGTGFAILTLGGSAGAWTLTDQNNNIYFGTSGQNYLKASSNSSDTWTIAIDGTSHEAKITSAASSRWIAQNASMKAFATYANTDQWEVAIYMVPSNDPAIEVAVTGSTSLGVGETATLTVTKLNGATGTVNWATSDSSALSLSATTGDSVTVTAGSTLGSATITASLTDCSDVQTSFVVRGGTLARPYTIAEAKAAIDSGVGIESVYVAGIISQIDSFNPTYSSITYWISDDGSTTNQFEVYSGKGLDKADFASINDIAVGASVVVFGDIQKHNSTYEFNYNNELVSYSYDESTAIRRQIETLDSSASLSYNFEKNGNAVLDLLNNANTINDNTNTYDEWTNESASAEYSGQSAGDFETIQLRTNNNNSGIVVINKQSEDLLAKKIYIKWNASTTDGRKLDIYGKDEQYSSPADLYGDAKGTKIGTFTYDEDGSAIQVITIGGDYEYIGIRSNSGALYLDSIVIQWGEMSYEYDDVAIRLGGKIDKGLWTDLNSTATIEGYGVLLSNATYLGETELKTKYDSYDGTNVKKFDMALATKAPVDGGDNYYWNLYKGVTNSLTTDFVAVAYIRTSKGVVFLKQVTASTKSLANDLINDKTYDLDAFEGTLADLACKQ